MEWCSAAMHQSAGRATRPFCMAPAEREGRVGNRNDTNDGGAQVWLKMGKDIHAMMLSTFLHCCSMRRNEVCVVFFSDFGAYCIVLIMVKFGLSML